MDNWSLFHNIVFFPIPRLPQFLNVLNSFFSRCTTSADIKLQFFGQQTSVGLHFCPDYFPFNLSWLTIARLFVDHSCYAHEVQKHSYKSWQVNTSRNYETRRQAVDEHCQYNYDDADDTRDSIGRKTKTKQKNQSTFLLVGVLARIFRHALRNVYKNKTSAPYPIGPMRKNTICMYGYLKKNMYNQTAR